MSSGGAQACPAGCSWPLSHSLLPASPSFTAHSRCVRFCPVLSVFEEGTNHLTCPERPGPGGCPVLMRGQCAPFRAMGSSPRSLTLKGRCCVRRGRGEAFTYKMQINHCLQLPKPWFPKHHPGTLQGNFCLGISGFRGAFQ